MAEKENTIKTRENDNLELFENYLVDVLERGVGETDAEDKQILVDLNRDIIALFDDDPDFQKKLENALYRNQEKLTSKKFELEGEQKRPTIGNWLKHFIKREGTQMYGNVTLSRFLSNSSNVKRLDKKEVDLVRALLVLYRNLKFFPKSMEGVDPEKWEIVPIREEGMENSDREEQKGGGRGETQTNTSSAAKEKKKETSSADKKEEKEEASKVSKKREDNKKEEQKDEEGGVKESSPEESRLEKLKRIKDNYEEGSLERKAIESEIRELEK